MPPTKKTKTPVAPKVAAKSTAKQPAAKAAAKSPRTAVKPTIRTRKVAAATKGSASRAGRASAVPPTTENYKHDDPAVQRPDVGVQHRFAARKPPKTYRYDSSLDPALSWDENASRDLGDWLIGLIDRVATEGEAKVFAQPQEWQGGLYKIESLKAAAGLLKTLSKPYLDWAGKAERHQITVPTVPLFVHERHSTKAILDGIKHRVAKGTTLDLFGDAGMDVTDQLSAYEHQGPWANRMILGDSLQVMNSLLEYEGLGGQVQMIYMDPPYGVKFGSNFQPFVRKRTVSDGADDDLTREPEMVKAYRDTWELGLHSYLTYLRDRLLLAKELLHESGSVFVQISDANLHHVRSTIDEVFGAENFVVTLLVKKTGSQKGSLVQSISDYLIWFAKSKVAAENYCTKLYQPQTLDDLLNDNFNIVEFPDGREVRLSEIADGNDENVTSEYVSQFLAENVGARLFASNPLTSGGFRKNQSVPFRFRKRDFDPGIAKGNCWKHTAKSEDGSPSGMERLAAANRLFVGRNQLRFKRYITDFPYKEVTNWWDGLGGASKPIYVVQTNSEIVKRCLLIATKPGDLVLDTTCGSGTTAYVAEQWGRRWITCDTSRVPLALARQRLLTATFPYFGLKDPKRGPQGGFVYARKQNQKGEEIGGRVPHITSSSIANDEMPTTEVLVDRPEIVKNITRVSGPFVVEATLPAAMDLTAEDSGAIGVTATRLTTGADQPTAPYARPSGDFATHIERMLAMLRQSKTLRLPGNKELQFAEIRAISDGEWLHAEAVEQNGSAKRIAIVFGPQDGAVTSHLAFEATSEAKHRRYEALYVFGFAVDPKAHEFLLDPKKAGLPAQYVAVTPDVVMDDLLKTNRSSEIFSVTGLPDVDVRKAKAVIGDAKAAALWEVEVRGLDIFNPASMSTESTDGNNLPCWMLDTDYNGMSFFATQVFFPKTQAWDNLKRSLGASLDESVWDHLAGTVSEAFAGGEHKRIAVKVIDERGNELMVVKELI